MEKGTLIRRTAWVLLASVLILFYIISPEQVFAGTGASAAAAETAAAAPTEKVVFESCVISSEHNIVGTGRLEGTVSGSDNYIYFFELKPYEDEIGARTDYAAYQDKRSDISFTVPLLENTSDSRLYSKFVAAVFDGEKYVAVSEPVYVTNPEILAVNTAEYQKAQSKKGLLIENHMLADAFELGVKHVNVNLAFHHFLGEGIEYEYEGKTYHFNKALVEEYDNTIRRFSEKGMVVTAIILNGWNDAAPELIHPGTKKNSSAFYYGFNASTKEGYEALRAISSFLAERYGSMDSPYGKVSNWIFGNEINNQQWNYIGEMELEPYVKEFERAFRVFYTAVKSVNKNDRIFFSTDYNWNHEADGKLKYNAKDVIDTFNQIITTGGQIDWGLAYHPYSIPLTEPEFWDDDKTGLILQNETSPVVNFANLHVLTDYFNRSELKKPSGEVRNIILSEQGFTAKSATRGDCEELQAAALAYAYYLVDSNPDIDALIMSRQVDAVSETEQFCAFGLWTCDMNLPNQVKAKQRRHAWEVFKNIDNKKYTLESTEFAKELIGIEKWSDVVPNFRWKNLEK